jgi:hypothetical protein
MHHAPAPEIVEAMWDDLRLTEFDGGKYRGLDLRGNDLSQLCGLASLKQIVIDRGQTRCPASTARSPGAVGPAKPDAVRPTTSLAL